MFIGYEIIVKLKLQAIKLRVSCVLKIGIKLFRTMRAEDNPGYLGSRGLWGRFQALPLAVDIWIIDNWGQKQHDSAHESLFIF